MRKKSSISPLRSLMLICSLFIACIFIPLSVEAQYNSIYKQDASGNTVLKTKEELESDKNKTTNNSSNNSSYDNRPAWQKKEERKKYNEEKKEEETNIQTISYGDGSKYIGLLKGSQPWGKGIKTYADGTKYEGDWKYGNREGDGAYTYTNGVVFRCQFHMDAPQNVGTWTYPNGNVLVGKREFKNGKWMRSGVLKDKGGNIINSNFTEDDAWIL
jgi:hypothetical protein